MYAKATRYMLVRFQKIYLKIFILRSVSNVKILRLFENRVIGMLPGSRTMILNILESIRKFSYLNANTWSNVKDKLFKLRPIVSTLDGISYPFPWKTFSIFMRNMCDKGSLPYEAAYPTPQPPKTLA